MHIDVSSLGWLSHQSFLSKAIPQLFSSFEKGFFITSWNFIGISRQLRECPLIIFDQVYGKKNFTIYFMPIHTLVKPRLPQCSIYLSLLTHCTMSYRWIETLDVDSVSESDLDRPYFAGRRSHYGGILATRPPRGRSPVEVVNVNRRNGHVRTVSAPRDRGRRQSHSPGVEVVNINVNDEQVQRTPHATHRGHYRSRSSDHSPNVEIINVNINDDELPNLQDYRHHHLGLTNREPVYYRPVYYRVPKDYIYTETLTYYDLPWRYDLVSQPLYSLPIYPCPQGANIHVDRMTQTQLSLWRTFTAMILIQYSNIAVVYA